MIASGYRYSFEELAATLLPYADPRDADRERALPAQRPLSGLRLAASEGRSTSISPWSLWGRRLDHATVLGLMSRVRDLRPAVVESGSGEGGA